MVLKWRVATRTCKCLMHGFSPVMIQLPIVSVSVGVQRSSPIFQRNDVQCILINQIMLFLVDQCYYIVMWCKLHVLSKASGQVHNSYICLLCISGQSLSLWKFWYHPLTFDSLLKTLSKQLTMKYTVYQWKECHLLVINCNWYVFVCSVVFK